MSAPYIAQSAIMAIVQNNLAAGFGADLAATPTDRMKRIAEEDDETPRNVPPHRSLELTDEER